MFKQKSRIGQGVGREKKQKSEDEETGGNEERKRGKAAAH